MDDQKREITEAVGARIKYLRRMKEISQEELALKAGVNPAYFGQVERGLKCPTVDTLYKIAKAMEVSPAELLRSEELPNFSEDQVKRLQSLLSRVPAEKLDQVIRVVEDITELLI